MSDENLDTDTNASSDPDPERDEEQDERLKALEKSKLGLGSFGLVVKVVSGIGAILAVGAVIVGYGAKYGELKTTVEEHAKAIAKLQGHPDQCRANMEKLRDAVQDRLRQDENAVGELRGSMMALRTEVRVRHEEFTFARPTVMTGEKISMSPPGIDRKGQPIKMIIRKERPLPQGVQEDLAAEAADTAMDKAVKAAPTHHDDPLQKLTF